MTLQLITRLGAERKMMAYWKDAFELSEQKGLPFGTPSWDRLRNYEYESRLHSLFGGEWCIKEWCPFNGTFCSWAYHAPLHVLKETWEIQESMRDELTKRHLNVDYLVACLKNEYVRRGGTL